MSIELALTLEVQNRSLILYNKAISVDKTNAVFVAVFCNILRKTWTKSFINSKDMAKGWLWNRPWTSLVQVPSQVKVKKKVAQFTWHNLEHTAIIFRENPELLWRSELHW